MASLARPGGNLAGVTALNTQLWQKRIELFVIARRVEYQTLRLGLAGGITVAAISSPAASHLNSSPRKRESLLTAAGQDGRSRGWGEGCLLAVVNLLGYSTSVGTADMG